MFVVCKPPKTGFLSSRPILSHGFLIEFFTVQIECSHLCIRSSYVIDCKQCHISETESIKRHSVCHIARVLNVYNNVPVPVSVSSFLL